MEFALRFLCTLPCIWYSVGYTLVCATNEGLYARVSALDVAEIRFDHKRQGAPSSEPELGSFNLPLVVDKLVDAAKSGGFFSYIAGTAAIVLQHEKYKSKYTELPAGIYINNYLTTLPMRKGLSSSAAVCVLVATAFNRIFNLEFSQEDIMEVAFQVRCIYHDLSHHTSPKAHQINHINTLGRDVDAVAVRAHGPVCGDGTRGRGSDVFRRAPLLPAPPISAPCTRRYRRFSESSKRFLLCNCGPESLKEHSSDPPGVECVLSASGKRYSG